MFNPDSLKADYAKAEPWLKALMDGWADGLNFYLHTHPNVTPRVIAKFEPWMALSFSEGSIGGDIESVNIGQIEAFYSPSLAQKQASYGATAPERPLVAEAGGDLEPRGSNGIAIAGANTASGKAQLLINPHTTFFFREEAQMVSEEGLNAYGALTWGQFFIYQGFNDKAGWMHTSSSVDNIDESPNSVNPPNGWVYNTNNYPYSAAGANSPKQKDFPAYMDSGSENPRGVHAIRVLDGKKGFTLDSLIGAAYDSYLPEFDIQIPLLLKAHAAAAASNPLKAKVAEQIAVLKDWDYRWSVTSVPTSVAIFYGEDLWQRVSPEARKAGINVYDYMRTKATAQQRLESLAAASDKLQAGFGKWQTPWGDINRNDQADRYATGNLRDVYFYRPQLEGHIERQYKPGE